ncbi:unnamed protein product [Ambrosiozyma monospora]|uniref:Unnamed protein product n=1 Tax=Ambrosiozyma monospora TaxID=43982 RepID=A0ACB5TBL9_AMBMO|nr:unnamed protein product [Ambrosiozyma monospora]
MIHSFYQTAVVLLLSTTLVLADFANPGYVKLSGQRLVKQNDLQQQQKRSDDYIDLSMTHIDYMYTVNVSIGSNNQKVTVQIDTGSSDFWVLNSNNTWCETTKPGEKGYDSSYDCSIYGVFTPEDSTSWVWTDELFTTEYEDHTGANGTFGTDVITLDGTQIHNVTIAVSDEADENFGVLGIGFMGDESTNSSFNYDQPFTYDNLPVTMKKQGLIHKNTYSIYLDNPSADMNDTDDRSAVLLFGAIDHDKYVGDLGLLPISSNDTIELDVILNSIEIESSTSSSKAKAKTNSTSTATYLLASGAIRTLLDTGTSNTLFPNNLISAITSYVGKYESKKDVISGKCSDFEKYTLIFNFQGYNLSVPLSGFISNKDGSTCELGISSAGEYEMVTLGDTFLSNVYFVADLDDGQIAIALANSNSTTENLEAIVGTIPSATSAINYDAAETGADFEAYKASSSLSSSSSSSSSSLDDIHGKNAENAAALRGNFGNAIFGSIVLITTLVFFN